MERLAMERIMARVTKVSNLTTAKLSISILGVLVLLFAATAGRAWHQKPSLQHRRSF